MGMSSGEENDVEHDEEDVQAETAQQKSDEKFMAARREVNPEAGRRSFLPKIERRRGNW
jgi:hypothetical protein